MSEAFAYLAAARSASDDPIELASAAYIQATIAHAQERDQTSLRILASTAGVDVPPRFPTTPTVSDTREWMQPIVPHFENHEYWDASLVLPPASSVEIDVRTFDE